MARLTSLFGALAILMCGFGFPAAAKDGPTEVDAEIVFAVDISYSMDSEEQFLQRNGYAEAFTSEQFLNVLKGDLAIVGPPSAGAPRGGAVFH